MTQAALEFASLAAYRRANLQRSTIAKSSTISTLCRAR